MSPRKLKFFRIFPSLLRRFKCVLDLVSAVHIHIDLKASLQIPAFTFCSNCLLLYFFSIYTASYIYSDIFKVNFLYYYFHNNFDFTTQWVFWCWHIFDFSSWDGILIFGDHFRYCRSIWHRMYNTLFEFLYFPFCNVTMTYCLCYFVYYYNNIAVN